MIKVGITGGIGSGKSQACAYFASLGIPVYDSDSRAKQLMSCDKSIINSIIDSFGPDAYVDGDLNRQYLSQKVFQDAAQLAKLNGIVHPAVANDFKSWLNNNVTSPYVIMECAILFESGFDKLVDKTIVVTAPYEVRLKRVMERDRTDIQNIRDRISKQSSDETKLRMADYSIVNDGSLESLKIKVFDIDKLLRQ